MNKIGRALIGVILLAAACSSDDPTTSPTDGSTVASSAPPSASTGTSNSTVPVTEAATATTQPSVPPATDVVLTTNDDPPAFPAVVDGYEPFGAVETQQLRLFSGQPVTTLGYGSSAGACFRGYWVVRWRSVNGPAKANLAGYVGDEGMAASDLPPVEAGERGYLAGSQCAQAVFYTDESLIDIVVEYQAYTPTVDASADPLATIGAAVETIAPEAKAYECSSYTPAFDLPLRPCDTAITVTYIQNQLSYLGYEVDSDGQFGYATQVAVFRFQASQGLEPDGLVGRLTWIALMTDAGLPGFDENGDGVVFPDELGE